MLSSPLLRGKTLKEDPHSTLLFNNFTRPTRACRQDRSGSHLDRIVVMETSMCG